MVLRAMRPADAAGIAAIAAETPAEGWTARAFEREVTTNAGARYLVAVENGVVVGFGGLWLIVDQAHITNMGVALSHRGRGIGRLLLYALFDIATRAKVDSLTLEVRVSNDVARALYTQFGFYETGRRTAYYRDTGEDALIMTTESLISLPVFQRLQALRDHIQRDFPGILPVVAEAEFETGAN